MISFIAFCIILFIYFAIPDNAFPTDAPNSQPVAAPCAPVSDPSAAPTNAPRLKLALPLSVSVPLPPDAISVNAQKQSYVRHKFLKQINIKV
jgi:hypothetical protein